MTARPSHLVRALAAALAAILLCSAPAGVFAQEKPQPVSTSVPQPTPDVPASASDPSTVSPTIHPGDHLAIAVYGEPALTQTVVVQADGTIQYGFGIRLLVGGLTAAEARDALAKSLKKYLKHPIVSLAVQQQGAMSVTVMGNVKTQGKYQLRSGSHISDAIAAAGGFGTTNGDLPAATVLQADGTVASVNLQKLIRGADPNENVALDDNALVYVKGAETIRVIVYGAVSRPGNVDINEGERLSAALARAGAESTVKPDLNRVLLTRTDPNTKLQQTYEINVYQGIAKSDPRYDPVLQKDDKVFVPEAKQLSAGTIGVLGLLGRLLRL